MALPALTGDPTYDAVLLGGLVLAVLIAAGAAFFPSPYGRFSSERFGPNLHPKVGWILMELPAPLVFALTFLQGDRRGELVPLVFLAVWLIHYANRGFINPLLMRVREGSSFSLTVVLFGWLVTVIHGWLYGRWVSHLAPWDDVSWLTDPRFLAGISTYYAGFVLNVHSDALLRGLRPKGPLPEGAPRYRIPRGGGFRWVSSPHYLGEILAWCGLALAAWCPGGLFVLLVTLGNLVPRALATHRWYRERFADYPSERKALVPWLL